MNFKKKAKFFLSMLMISKIIKERERERESKKKTIDINSRMIISRGDVFVYSLYGIGIDEKDRLVGWLVGRLNGWLVVEMKHSNQFGL